jgi:hypothetical protein
MPSVYLETTIVSYLTARKSRDVVVAGHQRITRAWWRQSRPGFDLFASEIVVQEASAGDARLAKRRLTLLRDVTLLSLSPAARELAKVLIQAGAIPASAAQDAFHLAVATVNRLDYLLTWNCRHLANAAMRNVIAASCVAAGYSPLVICTPEELSPAP